MAVILSKALGVVKLNSLALGSEHQARPPAGWVI